MSVLARALTTVLLLLAPRGAQEGLPPRDEALWQTVKQWLAAVSAEERDALTAALEARLGPESRVVTVQQLFLFSNAAEDTRGAMAFGVLRRALALGDEDLLAALVPLLEVDDPALRRALAGSLAALEDASADRGPTFAAYRPLLEARRALGEPYPPGLVRHLYAVDAHRAFRLLLALEPRTEERFEALRALLLAEHEVEDARWRLAYRFATASELDPAAFGALQALAASPDDLARLYAAQVLVLEPDLRGAVPARALRDDAHPVVRELAAERERLETR